MNYQTERYVVCDQPATPLGRIKLGMLSNSAWAITPDAMRSLDHYIISYVVEGTGIFSDQRGFHRAIGPGDLVCKFPGVRHYSMPTNGVTWTRFFIAFEGPVFDLWRTHRLLDPGIPVVHLEPVSYWLGRLHRILDIHQPSWEGRSLLEVCRLQEFLADAYCHRESDGRVPADRKWLDRACRAIDESLDPRIGLDTIAKKTGSSYGIFRRRFTRLTGVAPGHFRALRLISKASDLLVDSEQTSKEIAYRLGFADEFHFSRRFKKVTGHGPREFRNLHRLSGRREGTASREGPIASPAPIATASDTPRERARSKSHRRGMRGTRLRPKSAD